VLTNKNTSFLFYVIWSYLIQFVDSLHLPYSDCIPDCDIKNHFILTLTVFDKWLKVVPIKSPTDKV